MVLLRLLALFVFLGTAAAQDRYFDAGGVRIRYVDMGSGPAVVLVHGFTGDIERSWINTGVLANLSTDHRVLAFDLRGHGHSGKPHDPRAYDEIGLDVIRLLDHTGVKRAHVVGYSLGGIIIAKLLTTHPERFTSALIGGAAYRRSRSARADRENEAAAREVEAGIYRALIISTAATDEPRPGEEAIQARSREIAGSNDVHAHAALMRARRALLVSDAEIAAVRVPTLALVGGADPALLRVQAMREFWQDLHVQVVPGATHPTVHERGLPRRPEFAQAIRRWIAN
ncbi:MAG TPA: alpha/beta fold hydrolase [Burkholderiales bacterium]|jgi:pimeloyl-ACP methyl ester carboxylesterase|nr:alpha/beta fold hydrolase [Burkholderiales bacterium]